MAEATYAIPSFHGGEISQFAQGRFDRPDYKISLNVCLNFLPLEIGALTRRPGTQYAGHTRAGAPGRVMEFDFEQSNPITMEFTNGWLRFRSGPTLLTTNDAATISAISAANPAVVQTSAASGWSTGNTVMFLPGTAALLENRQFTITVVDGTHFSLQDALTGANIDGSTLGTITTGKTVQRVQELQTVYGASSWAPSLMRSVQAEETIILLNSSIAPQAVTVSALPTATANATFAIGAVTFNDGPYLDPFTNGLQVTPGSTSGIVTMTLSFPTYSSSKAYAKGAFVVSSGTNYVSLQDQNVNNTPASSPTFWQATSIGAAINNGAGLSNTDIGRLVRFFNEPSLWSSSNTYGVGNLVTYNPSGIVGNETYWQSLTSGNTGNAPGTDTTNWQIVTVQYAAIWTWGKITSLSNAISGSTGANIGNLTGGGGLAAGFDGNTNKSLTSSAENSSSGGNEPYNTIVTLDCYIGKNYTGAGGEQIDHVVVYPSNDQGLGYGTYTWEYALGPPGQFISYMNTSFTLNLRGSATSPSSPSNGTLLGTVSVSGNTTSPITIPSNNTSTSYNYVWVEVFGQYQNPQPAAGTTQISYFISMAVAQVAVFNPTGTASGAAFNVEILGPSLLRATLCTTWRMGAWGGPNGYPTCGCYAEGRAWFGGAIANRFDASVANGINGSTINMAPTDQYGVVADDSAIDETLNSDSVNPIIAMKPDLQGVVMLTLNGEWLVQAPTSGPISPTNIAARRMTKHGSANIEPVRVPHAIIMIQRYARKLLEYFADAFSGKFSAPNLADKAEHITANGIAEIAYTESTTPVIWGYDSEGNMFGVTYRRNTLATSQPPDFYAWQRHSLGTGRLLQSICAGASVGGELDALTMVTNDASTDIRHVEVITDVPNELNTLAQSWYLDDAVNPTSTTTTNTASAGAPYGGLTVHGLWHLNGKTVQVFAGGLDCGDLGDLLPTWKQTTTYTTGQQVTGLDGNWYTALKKNIGINPSTDTGGNWSLGGTDYLVSNGAVTVPYGDGVSAGPGRGLFTAAFAAGLSLTQIVVGMTYNSDGQLVRPVAPADSGARMGPAVGKSMRGYRYAMKLVNSLGLFVGSDFSKMTPANYKQADGVTAWPRNTVYSGLHYETLNDNFSHTRMLCFRVSRPVPTTITTIAENLTTQDQ